MAVAIAYSTKSSYVAFSGASSTAFTGLPTGVPVIIAVVNDYGSTATLSGFQLASDALSPTDATAMLAPVTGHQVLYLYFSSITTANQNLTFTNSGSYAEGKAFAFTVTGHDTSAPFGTETADASVTPLNFTFDATGDAVLVHFFGTAATTYSFSEGTWSNSGQEDLGITYWSSNLTAGVKSIAVTDGVPTSAALVEIKAAGGGGGGILLSQIERGRSLGRGLNRGL